MELELRPSVLYAGIAVQRRRRGRDETPAEARRFLARGSAQVTSFDYDGAFALAEKVGWRAFSDAHEAMTAFRETLERLIVASNPPWLEAIPAGRRVLRRTLDENAWQCFRIALLEGSSEDVVAWWDRLAGVARSQRAARLLALGRAAEYKSLQYERERLQGTGLEPRWVALEDNYLGYDIHSWEGASRPDGQQAPLYIEVKSSAVGEAIHLSRAEWDLAIDRESNWQLHIWIGGESLPLVLSAHHVKEHVPEDHGGGRWESVEIRIAELASASART